MDSSVSLSLAAARAHQLHAPLAAWAAGLPAVLRPLAQALPGVVGANTAGGAARQRAQAAAAEATACAEELNAMESALVGVEAGRVAAAAVAEEAGRLRRAAGEGAGRPSVEEVERLVNRHDAAEAELARRWREWERGEGISAGNDAVTAAVAAPVTATVAAPVTATVTATVTPPL